MRLASERGPGWQGAGFYPQRPGTDFAVLVTNHLILLKCGCCPLLPIPYKLIPAPGARELARGARHVHAMRLVQLLASLAAFGGSATAMRLGFARLPPCQSRSAVGLTSMSADPSTTLHSLLTELKPLGPIRAIVVMPGAPAILESTVDSSQWTLNEKRMPSGKTLLTAALPDKSFEFHVDTAVATQATLGISAKTQGPVVRVLTSDGAGLLTLLPSKEKAAEFDAVLAERGGLDPVRGDIVLDLVPTPDE